jgi:hypothetical protein
MESSNGALYWTGRVCGLMQGFSVDSSIAGCCARAASGHAAAPRVTNSRRFTAQYLPRFQTKGIAHLGTAALRDFNLVYDRLGSNSVVPVMSAARPLFPRKRKFIRDLAMSHSCQEATYAPQPTTPLFDHLIGTLLQKQRHLDADHLGGL